MSARTHWLLNGVLAIGLLGAMGAPIAQDEPNAVKLTLRWIDHQTVEWTPSGSIASPRPDGFVFAFHDGSIDLYDLDRPSSDYVARWMRTGYFAIPHTAQQLQALSPGSLAIFMTNPALPGGLNLPRLVTVVLDPARHRYLTVFSRIVPSDDAFVANEDPYRYEIFDAAGRFTGPLYADFFGGDILDAGVCENNETDLIGLDTGFVSEHVCTPESGVMRQHPGFNGSLRNPDGQPQRILGATDYRPPGDPLRLIFGAEESDFTRPGYRLGRLIVTRYAASGPNTGSWYSPERGGEGFNVELLEPEPPSTRTRVLVSWYTYDPDNSGRQMWLTGFGELDTDNGVAAHIEMAITSGGRFASTQNPSLVQRRRWGRIVIGFGNCNDGRVFYFPDDPAVPAGNYMIHRLSPPIEGLGWYCRDWRGPISSPNPTE